MRSPIGPILIVLGLGTTVVLVLLLLQVNGLRSDLENARADVSDLRARIETQPSGVTADELRRELDTLQEDLRTAIAAGGGGGGDPSQPAGGDDTGQLVDRLDEVLDRITALDERVSDICEGVPVC